MTASGPQMYLPVQQIPSGGQQLQQQHLQYQAPLPYSPNPYSSPSGNLYANPVVSAYGHFPPPLPVPPQAYAYEPPTVGTKRSSDDVFQSVDWLSKRPRPDSGGSVGYFPQRPGEKLCAFYMTTRTCSFGLTCKFDHPSWVPYGGIPNWKEVTGSAYNDPMSTDPANLPQRAGEPNCAFYMKTGDCKYGLRCKFNHPKDRQAGVFDSTFQTKEEAVRGVQNEATPGSDPVSTTAAPANSLSTGASSGTNVVAAKVPIPGEKVPGKSTPLNSKGLPLRQNETDCTYYIKTGSCKFGATCRFNHPEVIQSGARPVLPTMSAQSLSMSTVPTTAYNDADMYGHDMTVATNALPGNVEENGMTTMTTLHPQRPGGQDCSYFMKTGECSFGAACKYNHPPNRQSSVSKATTLKLTLAGLPRREGETICAYYMKTGSCKYGSSCRFDHPPPGEVAAKAAAEASRTEVLSLSEAYDVHQPPGVPVQ